MPRARRSQRLWRAQAQLRRQSRSVLKPQRASTGLTLALTLSAVPTWTAQARTRASSPELALRLVLQRTDLTSIGLTTVVIRLAVRTWTAQARTRASSPELTPPTVLQ